MWWQDFIPATNKIKICPRPLCGSCFRTQWEEADWVFVLFYVLIQKYFLEILVRDNLWNKRFLKCSHFIYPTNIYYK
jgi:hypothetical protein